MRRCRCRSTDSSSTGSAKHSRARGTSLDEQRRVAAEQLAVVEDRVSERYPDLLDDRKVRSLLLRGHTTAPEHARAKPHWRWLLDRRASVPQPGLDLNSRLAAARDLAELATVWAEACEAYPIMGRHSNIVAKYVEDVLLLQYARLGGNGAVHEFLRFKPEPDLWAWAPHAREVEKRGIQLLNTDAPEPFRRLRALGMDWDTS